MPWAHDHKAKHAAYMREWRKTHPMTERSRQHDICRSYAHENLKRGRLKKAPCFFCGAKSSQMHHPDYAKPLDVVWTCERHHRWIHQLLKAVHGANLIAPSGEPINRVQRGSVLLGMFHK